MEEKRIDSPVGRQLRWLMAACLVALLGCLFVMTPHGLAYANTLAGGAVEPDSAVVESVVPEMHYADATALPDDPKALFDAYAEKRLQEALPQKNNLVVQAVPNPDLTEPEKKLLAKLKELVAEVAAGSQTSTEFQIALSDLEINDVVWTPEALGVSSDLVEGELPQEAVAVAYERAGMPDVGKVFRVLIADCPYALYWHDKIEGIKYGYGSRSYSHSDGHWTSLTLKGPVIVKMAVVDAYKGNKDYTVNIADSERITQAIETASSVAKSNTDKSTLERLAFYKDYICDHVSYGKDWFAGSYGDPWQIIAVFDGDDDTAVVCEGYSKAFQYLVDLSEFSDDVYSYLVTGAMDGGSGAGAHMWNVVHMDDGKNYLVDVTNCDEGTIGAPGELFMAYGPSGSLNGGYGFLSNKITYAYDAETRSLYSDADLTISAEQYIDPTKTPLENAVVTVSGNYVYNGAAQVPSSDKVSVSLNGTILECGKDYTYSIASGCDNVNAGDVALTVTGKGRYNGEATGSFTIGRKSVTVKANNASKVEGSTDPSWSATVSGVLNGDKVNYTLACNHGEQPGRYEIKATGEAIQGNYAVSYTSGTFVITQNNTQNQDPDTPTETDDPTNSNFDVSDVATKADNPMSVSTKSKKVKLAKVKKKKQVVSGAIVVSNAAGPVSFSKIAKGSDKKLSINKKTGKITVKKGCKKGKHKINVLVTALGDENHNPATAIVKATIIVK